MAVHLPLPRFSQPGDLVRQLKTLPPAPHVILKIQELTQSDSSTVEDLVGIIRIERALAASIIQIANSAAYGLGHPCESIEESVNRLGFGEVQHLAFIISGFEAIREPLPAYTITAQTLWHQAVACAVAAEQLAEIVGENKQIAYISGLMHSVGMTVINTWAQSIAPGAVILYENSTTEWSVNERLMIGHDQAEAGAELLRAWKFPHAVVAAIEAQYAPTEPSDHAALVDVLKLARWLRTLVCPASVSPLPPPDENALLNLHLSEDHLQQFVPGVSAALLKARSAFGAI